MATSFTLPELGENIDSGTVTSVLVKVGDSVQRDQAVIELETDKAVVEVPCAEDGTVSEIHAKEGEVINVGDVILVLDGAATPPVEAKEEPPAPVETVEEPVAAPIPPVAPVEESTPPVIEETPAPPAQPEQAPEVVSSPTPAPDRSGTVRAAPSVRRMARELGIDIHAVPPSTAGATITAEDVKAFARSLQAAPAPSSVGASVSGQDYPLPNFEKYGHVTREKMSTIRRVTMESMARSWGAIPHVTQHDKADITELEAFRKKYGKLAERAGGKLTVTAILVRVLAEALKRFPQFNASLDPGTAEIVYKQYYNIGVAVDTERGLLVPSIKNADTKTLIDIAVELAGISERARTRKTSLDELQGGCMTITNLGSIGGVGFTPIVNLPEVAILGVSRSAIEPVFRDGAFVPRTMMPISLSYDHRVIDGADAARFARWICDALEQPMSIFLH